MKSTLIKTFQYLLCAVMFSATSALFAQPSSAPLTLQGMDQITIAGARVRAMGGASVANATDATALFSNPASLSRLTSFEIRVGGTFGATLLEQRQEWVPMREIPGISLLFESLTGTVKTPDSAGVPGHPLNAWETVQRQYDDLGPNWKKTRSATKPLTLAAAMPFTIANMNVVAALGVAQAIDLDHYYQNNNSMTPYLGQVRPDPFLITARNDTIETRWYQYTRSREGAVYGITPGISVGVLPGLTVGGSVTIMRGSSDDNEYRQDRGLINIAVVNAVATNFMVDTVRYYQTSAGTSTYEGNGFTLGAQYSYERFNIGITIKPSMKLTRSWERDVSIVDTTRKAYPVRLDVTRSYHENGSDEITFPMSYAIGVGVRPNDQWMLAFDYEMRNLADAKYASSGALSSFRTGPSAAASSQPWVNARAAMRFGAEYRPSAALALRAGYRQDIQAFSPDGSAVIDEPAGGDTYTAGAGYAIGGVMIDVAYEFARLNYQDIYQSNVNYNTRDQHRVFIEFGYRF